MATPLQLESTARLCIRRASCVLIRMQEPLRIVVIISDPALVAEGDAQAQALEDRSRLLSILSLIHI